MEQTELYDKINHLFSERDRIYQEREIHLKKHETALRRLEGQLKEKKGGLEKQEEENRREQEQLALQEKLIDDKKKELEKLRESISADMEQLMKEKLDAQELVNRELGLKKEEERLLMQKEGSKLGAGIHLDASGDERLKEENRKLKEENGKLKEETENLQREKERLLKHLMELKAKKKREEKEGPAEEALGHKDKTEAMAFMEKLAAAVKERIPGIEIQECSETLFAGTAGDKELQFLWDEPMVARILTAREESRQLLANIKRLNKKRAEWVFTYHAGTLAGTMYFLKDMDPDVVAGKCADAMGKYFK